MDIQIQQTCMQTINVGVAGPTRVDVYGAVTGFDSITKAKAKVDFDTKRFSNADGEEVTTTHLVITAGVVTEADFLWLPDVASEDPGGSPPSLSNSRKVQMVRKLLDEWGNVDHYEVRV